MGQVHSCPAICGAGPQLPGHLWGRPTVAQPVAGHYTKGSLSSPAATPHIHRADGGGILRRNAFSGHGAASGEPRYSMHPADLWQQFVEEMCSRDYEDCSEVPPATDIFAAFKGWAAGRYSVALTRGEVLDALGRGVAGGRRQNLRRRAPLPRLEGARQPPQTPSHRLSSEKRASLDISPAP